MEYGFCSFTITEKVKGYENMGIETLAKINDKKLFYFINSQNRTKIDLFCLTI
jgi:hypothetical protein